MHRDDHIVVSERKLRDLHATVILAPSCRLQVCVGARQCNRSRQVKVRARSIVRETLKRGPHRFVSGCPSSLFPSSQYPRVCYSPARPFPVIWIFKPNSTLCKFESKYSGRYTGASRGYPVVILELASVWRIVAFLRERLGCQLTCYPGSLRSLAGHAKARMRESEEMGVSGKVTGWKTAANNNVVGAWSIR